MGPQQQQNDIKLWELAAAGPELVFSPFAWRVRMALVHKGLKFESVPWAFTEKDRIKFADSQKVPVLQDGDTNVHDSWEIVKYLEKAYPDRPALFGSKQAEAHCHLIQKWADAVLVPQVLKTVIAEVPAQLKQADADYFRESREEAFGATLEQIAEGTDEKVQAFRKSLEPVRQMLQENSYLGGDKPDFSDFTVFSVLAFPRTISEVAFLSTDDPVYEWRQRLYKMHDDAGYKVPSREQM